MVNEDILEALELLTHKGFIEKNPKDLIARRKEVLNTKRFANKNILIIDTTGDVISDIIKGNAKKIDCYFENIFAKYYIELKVAFVSQNSYRDFINFFVMSPEHTRLLSYDKYYEISKYLSDNTRLFWDALYENTNYDGMKIRISDLFEQRFYEPDNYVTEKEYYAIRKNINNIEINFLKKLEDSKYDYVIVNSELYNIYESYLNKLSAKKVIQ